MLPEKYELDEAKEMLTDVRYAVPTIVGEDQHIVPSRIAELCVDLIDKVEAGELIECPEGLCCEHRHRPWTDDMLNAVVDVGMMDVTADEKKKLVQEIVTGVVE